jgi:16S rRNA processing protein RimM
VVGLVRSAHGLSGEVRVEILTDRPADRFQVGAIVHREGRPEPLTVSRAEPVADGPGWWVRFAEVADRTAAERLRGLYLEADVPATDRPPDAAWWHEVVGSAVVTRDGRELGSVVEVYRAGGAEVYVVAGDAGTLDVPAVSAVIVEWDRSAARMVVDADALGLEADQER